MKAMGDLGARDGLARGAAPLSLGRAGLHRQAAAPPVLRLPAGFRAAAARTNLTGLAFVATITGWTLIWGQALWRTALLPPGTAAALFVGGLGLLAYDRRVKARAAERDAAARATPRGTKQ